MVFVFITGLINYCFINQLREPRAKQEGVASLKGDSAIFKPRSHFHLFGSKGHKRKKAFGFHPAECYLFKANGQITHTSEAQVVTVSVSCCGNDSHKDNLFFCLRVKNKDAPL